MKKTCTQCHQEKLVTDFTKDVTRKDGRYSACKVCKRLSAAARYHTSEKETQRARDKKRSQAGSLLIVAKKSVGCCKCNERELVCLDLHHVDPTHKDFGVANSRNMSLGRIQAELDKCVVVCKNCHAKIHEGLIDLGD